MDSLPIEKWSGEVFSQLGIVRSFIVAFRSAKEWKNATFAERKATLVFRTMLGILGREVIHELCERLDACHRHRVVNAGSNSADASVTF